MRHLFIFLTIFILISLSNCTKKEHAQSYLNKVDSLAKAGNYLRAQLVLYNYLKSNYHQGNIDSLIRYYNLLGHQYKQRQKQYIENHYQKAKRLIKGLKTRMLKDIDKDVHIGAYWFPGVSNFIYANVMIKSGKCPYLWLVFNDYVRGKHVIKKTIVSTFKSKLEFDVSADGKTKIYKQDASGSMVKNHYRILFKKPDHFKLTKLREMINKQELQVTFEYSDGFKHVRIIRGRALLSLRKTMTFFYATYWLYEAPKELRTLES